MLRTLAHADYHLDIRYSDPTGSDRPVLGFGTLAAAHAVLMVPSDGAGPVQLWLCDSTAVAPHLLGLLGDVPAGRGTSITIPTEVLDQATHASAGGGMWTLAEQLRARGISAGESSALAHMCTGVNFGGQLGATARTGERDQRRGRWVIGFHHTEHGWYSQLRRDSTITVCPTDAGRLMPSGVS